MATEKNPKDNGANQQAQEVKEDSLGIYEEENKVNDPFMLEDQLLISQESAVQERSTPVIYQQPPSKASSPSVKQAEDDNSAMSFNFIYYIIDKFKLADPMD